MQLGWAKGRLLREKSSQDWELTFLTEVDRIVYAEKTFTEVKRAVERNSLPIHGPQGLVISAEATKAWLKLSETQDRSDKDIQKKMKADVTKLSKLQLALVTPRVFHLKPLQIVPVNEATKVEVDRMGDPCGLHSGTVIEIYRTFFGVGFKLAYGDRHMG